MLIRRGGGVYQERRRCISGEEKVYIRSREGGISERRRYIILQKKRLYPNIISKNLIIDFF